MQRRVLDVLDDDPLMTSAEVAALLGVNKKTVSRWAGAGLLPSVKTLGGHHRFRRSVVEALVEPGTP